MVSQDRKILERNWGCTHISRARSSGSRSRSPRAWLPLPPLQSLFTEQEKAKKRENIKSGSFLEWNEIWPFIGDFLSWISVMALQKGLLLPLPVSVRFLLIGVLNRRQGIAVKKGAEMTQVPFAQLSAAGSGPRGCLGDEDPSKKTTPLPQIM